MRSALVLSLPMLALAGCPADPAPEPVICLEAGAFAPCTPAYEPTYDNVYANTFQPTCAKSGFSCHSPEGKQGGLDFFDKEKVFTELQARAVKPGSPECSILAQRLISLDPLIRMPPGKSVEESQQCAVIQWIANGAKR